MVARPVPVASAAVATTRSLTLPTGHTTVRTRRKPASVVLRNGAGRVSLGLVAPASHLRANAWRRRPPPSQPPLLCPRARFSCSVTAPSEAYTLTLPDALG